MSPPTGGVPSRGSPRLRRDGRRGAARARANPLSRASPPSGRGSGTWPGRRPRRHADRAGRASRPHGRWRVPRDQRRECRLVPRGDEPFQELLVARTDECPAIEQASDRPQDRGGTHPRHGSHPEVRRKVALQDERGERVGLIQVFGQFEKDVNTRTVARPRTRSPRPDRQSNSVVLARGGGTISGTPSSRCRSRAVWGAKPA